MASTDGFSPAYLAQPTPWQNQPGSIVGIAATATVRHRRGVASLRVCFFRLTPALDNICPLRAVEAVHPVEDYPFHGVG